MLFVPLLLLERAPEPATTDAGGAIAPAVASVQMDAVTDERASAPPVEAAIEEEEDSPTVDGLQATNAVVPGDPAAVQAAPPPPAVVESATTTTTVPEVTTTTTTLLPVAKVLASVRTHHQSGQASWYQTADATCAHRTLPFGTIVTVIRVDTGVKATCRVSDRGPVAPERVIDLDYDTFARLADPDAGLIDVRLQW